MDRDDIADNLTRRHKGEIRNALEVSIDLVKKIEVIYEKAFIQRDDETEIDADSAYKSPEFNGYLIAISELDKVNIQALSVRDRICFFMNIYQCMYIHNYFKMAIEGRLDAANQSYFSKIKSYVWEYSAKPFYYSLQGQNFNLDELKHGVLRGNKKSPAAYMRTMSTGEPRT